MDLSLVCDVDILDAPGERAADFAPFCSYFRKSPKRLANSGIAVWRAASSPSPLLAALPRAARGNSCSLHSPGASDPALPLRLAALRAGINPAMKMPQRCIVRTIWIIFG